MTGCPCRCLLLHPKNCTFQLRFPGGKPLPVSDQNLLDRALYLFTGVLLSKVVFGLFIILFWLLCLIVSCAKGMKYLDRQSAYPDPQGWMF